MNKTQLQDEALLLPPEDRREIADALYGSLQPEPLSDWEVELLDQRVADADGYPERFTSWDEAKARIQKRIRRPGSKA